MLVDSLMTLDYNISLNNFSTFVFESEDIFVAEQ